MKYFYILFRWTWCSRGWLQGTVLQ